MKRFHLVIFVVLVGLLLGSGGQVKGAPGDSHRSIFYSQFGNISQNVATGVAVDADGYAYVAGYTSGVLPGQTSSGGDDVFLRKYGTNGNVLWTRQFGSSANDYVYGVAVDVSGNAYVAGETYGALPGQTSSGGLDAFVRKYDTNGNEQWTRQFGINYVVSAYGVAVDAAGNAYVAGDIVGALPGQTSSGGNDVFLRKYGTNGNELWTRQFGSNSEDYATGVAVDAAGNACVAGYTLGTLPGQTNYGGYVDAFVRKYDFNGNELWTRQFGTSSGEEAVGVAVDAAGNAYVAGYTGGAFTGQTNSGNEDAFARKYDTNGNELWTRQFGTSSNEWAKGVAVDAAGNAYVAGYTGGVLPGQTSSGVEDAFVRKYDFNGNEWWTYQFGSNQYDEAGGVAVLASGSRVYAAGDTTGALPGQTYYGGQDAYMAKLTDQDAARRQKLAILRPGGTWFIDTNCNGLFNPGTDLQLGPFGKQAGDIPVAIDWDGDTQQELAIFRPGGTWFIDLNHNGVFGAGDVQLGPFGKQAGDIPVAIDWNGDGRQELAVLRPGGTWFIDLDHNGVFNTGDVQLGPFGKQAGDIPVAIDWDGDGRQELAIFRAGTWFIDLDRNSIFGPGDVQLGPFGKQAGDIPVAIDWDGDGRQELAIFRPGGTWFIDLNHNGVFGPGDVQLGPFGKQAGDMPVAIRGW